MNNYKDQILMAKTYDDAVKIYNEAKLDKEMNIAEINLLNGLLNKNRYEKKMEFDKFILYLNIIKNIYYYDDAYKIFKDLSNFTNEKSQISTIRRILGKKPCKIFNEETDVGNNVMTKKCPHCGKLATHVSATQYVICGYTNNMFNWEYCGNDWCFQCGKKLCKNWTVNTLFNKYNRYHNGKCCKQYAAKIEDKYPNNYCDCVNQYVNRSATN